jgi:hypothetical protein
MLITKVCHAVCVDGKKKKIIKIKKTVLPLKYVSHKVFNTCAAGSELIFDTVDTVSIHV